MASPKKISFAFSCNVVSEDHLTATEIKEHFVQLGEQIESIQLYENPKGCYGTIELCSTNFRQEIFENHNVIRGVTIEFLEQPLQSCEEADTTILRLNDDCLQEVFNHLKVQDLCNVAEVCRRFKFNAAAQFPRQYKIVRWDEVTRQSPRPKFHDFSRILRTFGAYIDTLDIRAPKRQDHVMRMANRYCASTLRKLILTTMNIVDDDLIQSLRPLFSRLQSMCIDESTISLLPIMSFCSELRELLLYEVTVLGIIADTVHTAFRQHYSKLEIAEFDYVENLTGKHYASFLKMNPQLKALKIPPASEEILRAIARLDRLEKLQLNFDDNVDEWLLMKKANYFSKTSALKSLELIHVDIEKEHSHTVGVIMNALANSHIECLTLNEAPLDAGHIVDLCKAKSIKQLTFNDANIQFDGLLRICNSLTNLEHLRLQRCDEAIDDADELVKIVKSAKNLRELIANEVQIDLDIYNRILSIVSRRQEKVPLKIFLSGSGDSNFPLFSNPETHKDLLSIEITRFSFSEGEFIAKFKELLPKYVGLTG